MIIHKNKKIITLNLNYFLRDICIICDLKFGKWGVCVPVFHVCVDGVSNWFLYLCIWSFWYWSFVPKAKWQGVWIFCRESNIFHNAFRAIQEWETPLGGMLLVFLFISTHITSSVYWWYGIDLRKKSQSNSILIM